MAADANDIRTLDQLRTRLFQFSKALGSLKSRLEHPGPLTSWPTIQSFADQFERHLQAISDLFETNRTFFESTVAYPIPAFVDRSHENIVTEVVRKKLEPSVEDWVDRGMDTGTKIDERQDLDHLWSLVHSKSVASVTQIPWASDFTVDEARSEGGIDAVHTGLRRKLNKGGEEADDESDDDEADIDDEAKDESHKMDIDTTATNNNNQPVSSGPVLPMDQVLKFLNSGIRP